MTIKPATILRSALLLAAGLAAGAGGGIAVWQKLHPPVKPRPESTGGPGSLAPPDDGEADPLPEPVKLKPDEDLPPPVVVAPPPVVPPVVVPTPVAGPEFFGFPVTSTDAAPVKPPPIDPAPPVVVKPTPPVVPAAPVISRLEFMKDRCVAGFDGKSTLHDFTGWTKAVTGEIELDPARLAETAKATVSVDARTLDTGDADRDKEMHESVLESKKFPSLSFVLSSIRPGEGEAITMAGTFEIHGTKKRVEIPCQMRLRRGGRVWIKGEIRLKLSDFGIKPPSKMGMINVEDEIRVWFEAWAEPKK